jgi:hypothetical protein
MSTKEHTDLDHLRTADDRVLVTAFAVLTHRIHAADRRKGDDTGHAHVIDLRTQRDQVQDEILRRMGGE